MQKTFYIITDSVTTAMKGYRILNRNGIKAKIQRTSPAKSSGGCGYSIVILSDPQRAVDVLKRNYIKIKSVVEK